MMGVNLAGDLVKAHALLRGDLDLDERGDALLCGFVPVDHGLVAEDRSVFLKDAERLVYFLFAGAGHGGELRGGQARVLTEQIKQLFRVFHDNDLLFR